MDDLNRAKESHANARLVRKFTIDRDQCGRGYRVCERKARRYVARAGQLLSPWWYDGVD